MGDVNGIELFYWVAFLFGLGYSVVGVLGHGFNVGGHEIEVGGHGLEHGLGEAGHDVSHDVDGGMHVSPLNSATVAAFSAALGAIGLLSLKSGGLAPWFSFVVALVGALFIAMGMFVLVIRPLYRSQSDSTVSTADLLGRAGRVLTTIPGSGVGEIGLVADGSRLQMPAISHDGTDIPAGQHVSILQIQKGVARVAPLDEQLDIRTDDE
ncbi:MAG: NfeD family protein [Chloroflexota bacterium]